MTHTCGQHLLRWCLSFTTLAFVLTMTACQTAQQRQMRASQAELAELVARGEHGRARVMLESRVPGDINNRDYLLARMRLMIATLADGYAPPADATVQEFYDRLRTQGINRDKQAAAVILNEDLKIWKGEPFEQAMGLHYVGLHYAMQQSWDNLRAAEQSTLHHLIQKPQQQTDGGYVSVPTDFALGYVMTGIASQQLGRAQEAEDNFAQALKIVPELEPLITALKSEQYNTIFVVDYGRGPKKVGSGPDDSTMNFVPLTPSDARSLSVTAAGVTTRWPIVADINQMSRSQMWNQFGQERRDKSNVGTGLVVGGAATTAYGTSRDDDTATYVGLGMILAGAIAKAGAHIDPRYCELLPQRVYVAAVNLPEHADTVSLQVDGVPDSRMVLTGLSPPQSGAQLRYVRLINYPHRAPAWATSGQMLYANEYRALPQPTAPYFLGGRDTRSTWSERQQLVTFPGMAHPLSLQDLRELERAEGLYADPRDNGGVIGLHVLEGGQSLISPLPGTAGFARLFGQLHGPYRPRSEPLKQLLISIDQAHNDVAPDEPGPVAERQTN